MKTCKSERKSSPGLWMICSPSSMFHEEKIKYSTSAIETEKDRHMGWGKKSKRKSYKEKKGKSQREPVYDRKRKLENVQDDIRENRAEESL